MVNLISSPCNFRILEAVAKDLKTGKTVDLPRLWPQA